MSFKGFITSQGPSSTVSIGILTLRVCAGTSVFLKHGLEKLVGYSRMIEHFPDPVHIGTHASLGYALLADGICSVLVVMGLATRPASSLILINLLTAFFFVHHAQFFSDGHVELVWVYIAVFLALSFSGAGRISLDAWLNSK
jgi:putative oxidoreductase